MKHWLNIIKKGVLFMEQEVRQGLHDEILVIQENMSDMEVTSDEYSSNMAAVMKLVDRDIEYEKLAIEKEKLEVQREDLESKKKFSLKDAAIRVGVPFLSVVVQAVSYFWMCNKSLDIEFNKKDFISSDVGKSSSRKLMSFFGR